MNNNEEIYNPGYTGWSLEKNDWDEVKDTMGKIELDWNSLPLRSSFKEQVPNKKGIYLICGMSPLRGYSEYLAFKTPLYVGESTTNLRKRFESHCKGQLGGVRRLVSTWVPASLEFVFSEIEDPKIDEDVDQLIYDFETELMQAFGPTANIRRQKTSYSKNTREL
tara:strand:+ start:531 stop:1025 length:495 start_codon:yes stop_codon:yes gene_type:complete